MIGLYDLNEMDDCLLTSRIITKRNDNNYKACECHLLFPHEAIRREFIRADQALSNINVIAHPWYDNYLILLLIHITI